MCIPDMFFAMRENYIMNNFIICTLHVILLGWLIKENEMCRICTMQEE
jgi:hypothetical protein